jgi:hypothetical protein
MSRHGKVGVGESGPTGAREVNWAQWPPRACTIVGKAVLVDVAAAAGGQQTRTSIRGVRPVVRALAVLNFIGQIHSPFLHISLRPYYSFITQQT